MARFCNQSIWILVLLIILTFSCSKEKPKVQPKVSVETVVIEPQTIPILFQFVGICESSHQVEIWSRVEGYLKKVNYTEGGAVKEGDLLFEIDSKEFAANVAQVEANLEREKAGLPMLDLCTEKYHFDEKWAKEDPECKKRIEAYEAGDKSALGNAELAPTKVNQPNGGMKE